MPAARRGRDGAPLLAWQFVTVRGPSMTPTLRDGDAVVVRHDARVQAGDVVLARFRTVPDRLVVKRVAYATRDGWWLASDNAFAGGDSSVHGVADALARVVLRVRPVAERVRCVCVVRRVRSLPQPPGVADSEAGPSPSS